MSTVPPADFDAFKSSVVTDLTALRTAIITTQETLDVDVGVATDTFAAQAGPPPLVTTPGAPSGNTVWFPSVVNCPAAVPGEFSLKNSGAQMFDAAGNELLRIWATDPNTSNYNACNLYIGARSGEAQKLENVNTNGYYNVGIGAQTLRKNETGTYNVAVGVFAMDGCGPDVSNNTAVGGLALWRVNGNNNSAFGSSAMGLLKTGQYNDAFGCAALIALKAGSNNVGIGSYCGYGGALKKDLASKEMPEEMAVLPDDMISCDSQLVLVGVDSGRSMNAGPSNVPVVNAIVIGYKAMFDKSNTAVIGNDQVTDTYFGSTAAKSHIHASRLSLYDLPTAVDGLPSGTIWNNAGVLSVAP